MQNQDNPILRVAGLDDLNGAPVLDIKSHVPVQQLEEIKPLIGIRK